MNAEQPGFEEARIKEAQWKKWGRWLFHPKQKRFLLPATGVWILALDWLIFSSNALTALTATPAVMAVGFVLGSAGAYLIQRKGADDWPWSAALKAVLAGIVVGLPWPVGGDARWRLGAAVLRAG